jgi:hypothetical protein
MLIKKENIPAIKMDKVADDKKSVDAFVKTAQGKKV